MTKPTPPVPPDDLRARWFMDCASGEKFNTRRHADQAAAWGWEQAIAIKDLQPFSPEQLANMAPRTAPPVPPYSMPTAFNSTYAQAMQEREELAELIGDLAKALHEHTCLYEGHTSALVEEARAAAERLRGGAANG
jgi:hypothetical protein